MLPYILLGIGVICNVVANIFAKKATATLTLSPALLLNPNLIASIAFFGLAFSVYIWSLSKLNLHIAYPTFVSASMILVTLSAALFFGEAIDIKSIIGIVTILAGILILTFA